MAKRIYTESVKKAAKPAGLSAAAIIFLIFVYLQSQGLIEITGVSGDSVCAGTEEDPCYAYINFTVKGEDLFIYPTNYDPYGRNVSFEFTPGIKDWKLQRSWGTGWRNIPLDKGCTGTWCGGKRGIKENTFSIAFRANKSYQIRIVGYKYDPNDEVTWSFNPSGKWLPVDSKDINIYENGSVTSRVPIMQCKNFSYVNGSSSTECWVDHYETKIEYLKGKELGIVVNNKEYYNSYMCGDILVKHLVPVGDRNRELYCRCRINEIIKGTCKEVEILE